MQEGSWGVKEGSWGSGRKLGVRGGSWEYREEVGCTGRKFGNTAPTHSFLNYVPWCIVVFNDILVYANYL